MPVPGFAPTLPDTLGPVALQAGKRYIIRWRMSEGGGEAGYRVGWASASTPKEVLPTDLLFPAALAAAPTDLAAVARADGVRLVVTDNSTNETEFIIERRLSSQPDSAFVQVAHVPSTTGPQTGSRRFLRDATALPGLNYTYRVRAAGADGVSDPS